MVVQRNRPHPAAPQQDFRSLGRHHAGAKLAGSRRRRPALAGQIHPRVVDQIAAVQGARHQPQQEAQVLFLGRMAVEAEILLEAHAARQEHQVAGAHADRGCADRGDAERMTARIDQTSYVEHEEVEPIDEQIDVAQEVIDVLGRDAVAEPRDPQLGVDVARHLVEHLDLGSVHRRHHRAGLAVDVDHVEAVEVGDVKTADAQAGERDQMDAAHAAHAGNGHRLVAQRLLLPRRHPADVAVERGVVGELGRGHPVWRLK